MQLNGISTRGVATANQHKWAGLTSHNGKLYSAPQGTNQILVYDPNTRSVSGLSVPGAARYSGGTHAQMNGIASWDGKLYCAPRNTSHVLVYSLPNETASQAMTASSLTLHKNAGWNAAQAVQMVKIQSV